MAGWARGCEMTESTLRSFSFSMIGVYAKSLAAKTEEGLGETGRVGAGRRTNAGCMVFVL